jgi:23S rRNA (pseudouridine1915-N3)-methyltransferase
VRISVVVVGRPRQGGLADAIAEYETRAARYWPLQVHEVREESSKSRTAEAVMDAEAERLLARVPSGARLVACDPTGDTLDSHAFASLLAGARDSATDLAFVIGGAHGLGAAVRERASRRLSVAPWTLPHELARLVLAEQLYRAGTIARGEPYHK